MDYLISFTLPWDLVDCFSKFSRVEKYKPTLPTKTDYSPIPFQFHIFKISMKQSELDYDLGG